MFSVRVAITRVAFVGEQTWRVLPKPACNSEIEWWSHPQAIAVPSRPNNPSAQVCIVHARPIRGVQLRRTACPLEPLPPLRSVSCARFRNQLVSGGPVLVPRPLQGPSSHNTRV